MKAAKLYLCLCLILLSNLSQAFEMRLVSIHGGSYHNASQPWSGVFTSLDGNEWDASQYYQAKNKQFYTKALLSAELRKNLALMLPVSFDNGYQSRLYNYSRSLNVGLGLAFYQGQWSGSLLGDNLLQIGGNRNESPCRDSLNRDFHCGTGLPWTDPHLSTRNHLQSINLRLNYHF